MSYEFFSVILKAQMSNDNSCKAENIRRFLKEIPREVMFGMLQSTSEDERNVDFYIRLSIVYLLCNMGINHNYYGFKYLYLAILMTLDSKEEKLFITKEIYPDIARYCKVSGYSVERNMRYAIEKAIFESGKKNTEIPLKNYSNSKFIMVLAKHIRMRYMESDN